MFFFRLSLPKQIFIALVAGVAAGLFFKSMAESMPAVSQGFFYYADLIGQAFLRLLKMLIVPLVFFALSAGITRMDSAANLRKIGGFIVCYYTLTAIMASSVGLFWGMLLEPGAGAQGILGELGNYKTPEGGYSFLRNMILWIPDNIVQGMATTNMLQIIFFSSFIGLVLLALGEKTALATKFFREAADIMIKMTEYVMMVAPIGIFALIALLANTLGGKMVAEIMKFFVADYLGCLTVLCVCYPLLLKYFGVPVLRFYKNSFPAMLVAASTTSSAATLPMCITVAETRLGIPEKIYGFSLPLGNTTNMDGMAVAVGVISVFALGLHGQAVTLSSAVHIVYMGLILSIGAANVKGGGIIISAVLLESLGMDLTLLPILAAIWPIIDIPHTTTNITGDLVGASCCASRYNMLDWKIFNSSNKA